MQFPLINSDGDLARHLRHGREMLATGRLITRDPFSFSRPGEPFLAFEYGSQLLYATAHAIGGIPLVSVVAGLLIGTAYALLARFLLARRVDPLLAVLAVMVAAALGSGNWMARPHLVTYVGTALLLPVLEPAGRPVRPIFALPFFAVWANLHGGFVYGLVLIAIYMVGAWGEALAGGSPAEWRERARTLSLTGLAALAGTFITPHGPRLHAHVVEFFFRIPFSLSNTTEFLPPSLGSRRGILLLAVAGLGLAILVRSRPRPSFPRILLVLAGLAFAFKAARNVSLLGLTAVPILALQADAGWRRLAEGWGARLRFAEAAAATSTWPWVAGGTILLVALGLAGGKVGSLHLLRSGFSERIFPMAAVREARKLAPSANVFSEFGWGGYILYDWPEARVFIDGGTDFYGDSVFAEYLRIKRLQPGWRESLARSGADVVLLRRPSALARELERDPDWRVAYSDSVAILLVTRPRSAASSGAGDTGQGR